jgi:hypothetical protein
MTRTSTIMLAMLIPAALIIALAVMSAARSRPSIVAEECMEKLMWMDAAKTQWALEQGQGPNATPAWEDIRSYLPWQFGKTNIIPSCPGGGAYTIGGGDDLPTCSIPNHEVNLRAVWVRVQDGWDDIAGAAVEVTDESGRRISGKTDKFGRADLSTWPRKAISITISKKGYVPITISNSWMAIERGGVPITLSNRWQTGYGVELERLSGD